MELQAVIRHLNEAIRTFKADPPDTAFQRGYLAALEETREAVRDMVPAKENRK
jgi:hypothetical protein